MSVMPEVSAWTHIVLPIVPYLVPNKLPHEAIVHMLPDNTKNMEGGQNSVTLTCDVLYFSTWPHLAVVHNAAAKCPWPTSPPLPCKLAPRYTQGRAGLAAMLGHT